MHKHVSFTHIGIYIWFNTLGAPEDMQTHRDIILTLCCTLWEKIIQALSNASHTMEMHWLHMQGVWGGFTVLALSGFLTRDVISELGIFKHSGGVSFSSHWNDEIAFAWLYPCCDTVLVKDSWNSHCPTDPQGHFRMPWPFPQQHQPPLSPATPAEFQHFW